MKHVPVQHPSNEELFAYRDGELVGDRRLLIEAHVVSCQSCRELVDGMSAIEAGLKQRPEDVGDEYYARMTESVLAKIGVKAGAKVVASAGAAGGAGGAKAAEGARRPAEDVPRIDRRRPDQDLEGDDERRRPIFPWFGVVGTGAAAAAVLVVVVMLAQRQGEWVRAPRPLMTDEAEEPVLVPGDSGFGERENAPVLGSVTEEKAKKESMAPGAKNQALNQTAPPSLAKQDEALLRAEENRARESDATAARTKDQAQSLVTGEGVRVTADKRMEAREPAASAAPVGDLQSKREASPAPSAAAGLDAGALAQSSDAYTAFLRVHGLPAVFDPARVDRNLLLQVEGELRFLYMSGRAGTDSARVRLYLAEAARAKADPADSAAVEGVIHHYWRAIRLSRKDAAVSAMAWRRLEDYQRETGRTP